MPVVVGAAVAVLLAGTVLAAMTRAESQPDRTTLKLLRITATLAVASLVVMAAGSLLAYAGLDEPRNPYGFQLFSGTTLTGLLLVLAARFLLVVALATGLVTLLRKPEKAEQESTTSAP